MLFTKRVLHAYQRYIDNKQISQPVLCEFKKGELQVTKSWLKIIKFYLGLSQGILYSLYLTVQLAVQLKSKGDGGNQYFLNLLWTFLWGIYFWWTVGIHTNLILTQEESCVFIKGMIRLDKELNKFIPLPSKKSKTVLKKSLVEDISLRMEIFIVLEDIMYYSFAVCACIMAMALSKKPQFISFL
jgi:hypothetical protein